MLIQVCQPFSRMRKIVCGGVAIGIVGAFLLLPPIVGYLNLTSGAAVLILLAVLIMVPTVFYAINRLFAWGDQLWVWAKEKLQSF